MLSNLSAKIQTNESALSAVRLKSRRVKGLFTLYAGFAYVLYLVVLILLVGWRRWKASSALGVIVIPGCIAGVRYIVKWVYDRRINGLEAHLEVLKLEQKEKIEQLKTKTNFYSTQSLLERYGGPQSTPTREQTQSSSAESSPALRKRKSRLVNTPSRNSTPEHPNQRLSAGPQQLSMPSQLSSVVAQAPPLASPEPIGPPKWYDRLLDVIVGEDESKPQNRYALICKVCRTHNGLAPPGETDVSLIRYICPRCGTINGEEPPPKHLTKTEPVRTEVTAGEEFKEDDGKVDQTRSEKVAESNDKDDRSQ